MRLLPLLPEMPIICFGPLRPLDRTAGKLVEGLAQKLGTRKTEVHPFTVAAGLSDQPVREGFIGLPMQVSGSSALGYPSSTRRRTSRESSFSIPVLPMNNICSVPIPGAL